MVAMTCPLCPLGLCPHNLMYVDRNQPLRTAYRASTLAARAFNGTSRSHSLGVSLIDPALGGSSKNEINRFVDRASERRNDDGNSSCTRRGPGTSSPPPSRFPTQS